MASLLVTTTATTLQEVLTQLNLLQYQDSLIEAGYDMLNRFDTENNTVKELTEELKEDVPMKKPHARALVRYLFSLQHQPLLSAPAAQDVDDGDLPIAEAIPMSRVLNNPPSFGPADPFLSKSKSVESTGETKEAPSNAESSLAYTGTAIMYGSWVGNTDHPVQYISKLTDGRTVYIIQTSEHTKMVAVKDGNSEAKYYTGKVADFKAENWNTYANAGKNYLVKNL